MTRSLRILAAVVAGYVAIALIVIVVTSAAASLLVPAGAMPGSDYLVANLSISCLAAVAGGVVASAVARDDSMLATLLLAALVLFLGLAMESGAGQPGWYGLAIPLVGAFGVLLGGAGLRLLRRQSA